MHIEFCFVVWHTRGDLLIIIIYGYCVMAVCLIPLGHSGKSYSITGHPKLYVQTVQSPSTLSHDCLVKRNNNR